MFIMYMVLTECLPQL